MSTGFIQEAQEQRFSTWHNMLDQDILLDLHVGATRENPSGKVRYTVPAKGKKEIPKEFDMAIQHVRDGEIVGGLAPQLRREGASERLHRSLDDAEARKAEALVDAATQLKKRRDAEDAFAIATARAIEAETETVAKKAAVAAVQSPVAAVAAHQNTQPKKG